MPNIEASDRKLGWLFIAWTVMLIVTVVIGGVTRLTESGLSITEWNPVSGVLPPMGEAAWQEAFAKYQQIPQYQQLNAGMTLPEFQRIFWVEWIHRLWARLVGVAIAIPALVLLARGRLSTMVRNRILALLALMAVQGAMGWYMVASGLAGRTSVSQYRLAAHLSVALVLIGLAVWTAADLLAGPRTSGVPPASSRTTRLARVMVALVALTAVAGAFVAGLDAGRLYNTFPLMGGRWIPAGYGAMHPWYRNLFENLIAVQFNHRLLGLAVAALGLALGWQTRRDDTSVGTWGRAVGYMALVQIGLGIATLLLLVPTPIASMHQAGAVVLLCFSLLLLHATRRASDLER